MEYFLLEYLMTDGHHAVEFFQPFDDFAGLAVLSDLMASMVQEAPISFVETRNDRVAPWADKTLASS